MVLFRVRPHRCDACQSTEHYLREQWFDLDGQARLRSEARRHSAMRVGQSGESAHRSAARSHQVFIPFPSVR